MKAMISSTALDLPEHRRQVVEACLREGIFPIGMEQLPARDATGVQVSIEMVDEADIYIGVYAWRYGWVPHGSEISITEIEFNRAVERQQRGELQEILIFVMHEEHTIKPRDMEADATAQEKLKVFKDRASVGRVRKEFRNVDDLRGLVVQALADWRRRYEVASDSKPAPAFHAPSSIPTPPKAYIAHPYVLLQTKGVIGRRKELNELTDWITKNKQIPADIRIFSVLAMGGMGKSALTWKWFEAVAPNELPNLAGRMWWSFYESDARWENFIIRALAYTAGMPETEVRQLKPAERDERLLRLLDERPFLLVLDGLERILIAYARIDAAYVPDDDLDQQTANTIAGASGLPDDIRESYVEKHRLRQCADVRAGVFLRKLARVRASRVLISTRLYPAELQTQAAQPLPGCYALFLRGLIDDDALALWRGFVGGERSGTSDQLLPLFGAFGNYPLLLRALAGEVARYRPAPGDFDRWRKDHPDFDPAALPLRNAKTHVLGFALHGLGEAQRRVLYTLAAFRMPTTWDTLSALLVGEGKPCADNRALDAALTELEDRGLVGWDRRANRYDLHPIVRGVVWIALNVAEKRDIYLELHSYFDATPKPPSWEMVESIEDLTPALELFHDLIGLERYDDALKVFTAHLNEATLYRLSASRLREELLEQFFPEGVDAPPRLRDLQYWSVLLEALGNAYRGSGKLGMALTLYRRALKIAEDELGAAKILFRLGNLSAALLPSGYLREAELVARRGISISQEEKDRFQERVALQVVGAVLAARNDSFQSQVALNRSLEMSVAEHHSQREGVVAAYLSQLYLWLRNPKRALSLAQRAWELAHVERIERDFIRAALLQGEAALGLGDLQSAEERLQHALNRARAVNDVEGELPALSALAELHRQRKQHDVAVELLEQVWIPAERGPYPLRHADARNILSRLERDLGHRDAAIDAAAAAFRLAWCDGPPFAYHYGLTNARRQLQEFGAPVPDLSPLDETKSPPMPDVDINPKDESWVDPKKLSALAGPNSEI
jgi:tetratricopeptide (TPR) repeat protein